jgi:hypothetical protein
MAVRVKGVVLLVVSNVSEEHAISMFGVGVTYFCPEEGVSMFLRNLGST